MIALQGVYNKGWVELFGQAPAEKANVVVVFPHETKRSKMTAEDRQLFKKFSGSIKRDIDERKELIEALEEKQLLASQNGRPVDFNV
ncbi:MAG: hypothetical protein IJS96_08650 [Schwartzia sp.]|nr:hypothetical protein [Schwartzia sp. (in: firmicutes)]